MLRKHLHPHPVVNCGIILMLLGILVTFYALILSDSTLYAFVIKIKGAEEVLHGIAPHSRTSQEAYIAASFLVVIGAGLDVWRRLQDT
jgi:hypothetical protein